MEIIRDLLSGKMTVRKAIVWVILVGIALLIMGILLQALLILKKLADSDPLVLAYILRGG